MQQGVLGSLCAGDGVSLSPIFMVKESGDVGHRKDDVRKAFLQAKCTIPEEEIRAFAPKGKTEVLDMCFWQKDELSYLCIFKRQTESYAFIQKS